ncbi:SOS response-associated peptidase [Frankia sp. AgB32]|uniref:SOS response-associated peptidase n=1 Tax=Frankia sp. AgB32 TaxID=631119 RepID=UPI00200D4D46|nr:SOS response-associated peptidase [Frankia sp. AgB32]MCK9895576.1 SOS response-associated peptidase [Frankia sp. AgB32]
MCGRYTQKLKSDDLVAAMSARDETDGGVAENHNVFPTSTMPIVVPGGGGSAATTADAPGGAGSAGGRALRLATWGLVPSWAKDRSIGAKMINARAETVATKPAFRSAYASRRCLVPASGFYEWFRPAGGGRRGQPFYVHPAGHPASGGIFAFAGLYEVWRKGDEPLVTFTILTTGPAEGLAFLHDRSPVILPTTAWDRWLDPAGDPAALESLLRPAPAGVATAHPVVAEVGNVRNRGSHLSDPVDLDPAVAEAIAAAGGPSAVALDGLAAGPRSAGAAPEPVDLAGFERGADGARARLDPAVRAR